MVADIFVSLRCSIYRAWRSFVERFVGSVEVFRNSRRGRGAGKTEWMFEAQWIARYRVREVSVSIVFVSCFFRAGARGVSVAV